MKIIITVAFALGISFTALAQANRTTEPTASASLNLLSNTTGEIDLNNRVPGNYIWVITLPTNNVASFVTGNPIAALL